MNRNSLFQIPTTVSGFKEHPCLYYLFSFSTVLSSGRMVTIVQEDGPIQRPQCFRAHPLNAEDFRVHQNFLVPKCPVLSEHSQEEATERKHQGTRGGVRVTRVGQQAPAVTWDHLPKVVTDPEDRYARAFSCLSLEFTTTTTNCLPIVPHIIM